LGRTWAEWQPIWHWVEPALLVLAAIAWGALLHFLIEKPANAWLKPFGARSQRVQPASARNNPPHPEFVEG
jgi:peptidoglycan/LPS O-acetylase OafA/YrhL